MTLWTGMKKWRLVFPTCQFSITYVLLSVGVVVENRAWLERQRKGPYHFLVLEKDNPWRKTPEMNTDKSHPQYVCKRRKTNNTKKLKPRPSAAQFADREKRHVLSWENSISFCLYGSFMQTVWHKIKNEEIFRRIWSCHFVYFIMNINVICACVYPVFILCI